MVHPVTAGTGADPVHNEAGRPAPLGRDRRDVARRGQDVAEVLRDDADEDRGRRLSPYRPPHRIALVLLCACLSGLCVSAVVVCQFPAASSPLAYPTDSDSPGSGSLASFSCSRPTWY